MPHKGRFTLEFVDGRTQSLNLSGKALNRGAAGVIYRAPDGKTALKFYHEQKKDQTRRNKVWQMIQHPPEDAHSEHFAWPTALILNSRGTFAGLAMPLLPIASYVSLDLVLSARGRKMQSLPEASAWRLDVAINLAKRVAELHARGHCIIDLKPANLLVHRRSADVAVVDCDGFAIKGDTHYFPANQFTAGFIAPEAFRSRKTPQELREPQDAFALAVIVFSLLNGGLHPYQGVPKRNRDIPSDNQNRIAGGFYPYGLKSHTDLAPSPWSIHQDLPRILRETFDRSFSEGKRPSAHDWAALLQEAKTRLKRCTQDEQHSYWGSQCPHCARGKTRVKVATPPRKRTRSNRARPRPVAPPVTPAITQRPPRPAATPGFAGAGTWIFITIVGALLIALLAHDNSSSKSSYSPAFTAPPEPAPVDPRSLAWKALAPESNPIHIARVSAPYAEGPGARYARSGPEIELEPIPFYHFGAFEQPESVAVLTGNPRNSDFLGLAETQVNLASFDATDSRLAQHATYTSLSAAYGLSFWQADPRKGREGIYLPQCGPRNCDLLQRLSPTDASVNYELPEWQSMSAFEGFPPWRYQLSPKGDFMVLASASQIAVYGVDQPSSPIALLDLPDTYAEFVIDSLSVGAEAGTIMVGLSKQKRFGVDFEAVLLELTRNGSEFDLDESFAERARAAGTELLGSYQTLSLDGQTLAVSEYQQPENNSTDYSWLNQKVTVALGYPAISVWKRDDQGKWQLRQRIEWQGRKGSRKIKIRRPKQMELLNGLGMALIGRKIRAEGQVHQELQLSPDGTRLLTGLEASEYQGWLYSSSYLFDITGDSPEVLTRLTSATQTFRTSLKAAYPSIRMSTNGKYAVMGWFKYYDNAKMLEQSVDIRVFAILQAESAIETDNAASQPFTTTP